MELDALGLVDSEQVRIALDGEPILWNRLWVVNESSVLSGNSYEPKPRAQV